MQAPMTNYRPIETARLIPSLANQSLVVLQNRKQEILDQLDKIATVTSANNQQVSSVTIQLLVAIDHYVCWLVSLTIIESELQQQHIHIAMLNNLH